MKLGNKCKHIFLTNIMGGNMNNFVKGKHYYNVNGSSPFIVKCVVGPSVEIQYVSSGFTTWLHKDKIESRDKKGKKMTKYKLKKSYEKDNMFTLVGPDKDGNAVIQDSFGTLIKTEYSNLEKVVPYTVGIRFYNVYGGLSSPLHHYFSKEGVLYVGDRIIMDGRLAQVVKTNNKSEKATLPIHGEKIYTTPIEQHYNE